MGKFPSNNNNNYPGIHSTKSLRSHRNQDWTQALGKQKRKQNILWRKPAHSWTESQKKGTYSELGQRQNHLPNDSQFSSVAQSCPTFCNPMDCSTPGFPVHHQLPEFAQTHVHWVSNAIQPPHPLSSPSPPNNFVRKKTEQGSEIGQIVGVRKDKLDWVFRKG